MLSLRKSLVGIVSLAGAVLSLGSASAAPIPWAVPAGATPSFTYNGGQSDKGLFGEPLFVGSTLLLTPNNFRADSVNGVEDIEYDRLQFDLHMVQGKTLQAFGINEIGDYEINDKGSVAATTQLMLVNLDTTQVVSNFMATAPAMPLSSATYTKGNWSGSAAVTVLPPGWTNVRVIIQNTLTAQSEADTAVWIAKKWVNGGIDISLIIPEPTSFGLLASAGAMLLIRRNRAA